jgi:hypothetical protein
VSISTRRVAAVALPIAAGIVLAGAAGTAVATPSSGAHVAPANAGCGVSGSTATTRTGHALTAAQIRNGSSTSCPAVGAAQPGDVLDYRCFTHAGSFTWTFLKDTRTGVVGWVRDDLLSGDGALFNCGF